MAALHEIIDYLDKLLKITEFQNDSSNNGLQVEACSEVKKAVFSVDASLALFKQAAAVNADFIFTHHGLSWGSEPRRIVGFTAKRLAMLFNNHISLYAAHLPLDGHPEIGNNARLGDDIGLGKRSMFCEYHGSMIGVAGELARPEKLSSLAEIYRQSLSTLPEIFGNPETEVVKIGIISGEGGSSGLNAAIASGLDCFITGEFKHEMFHLAKEAGMTVLALGHYCSETIGVKAVMEIVKEKFDIVCEFIDLPTGL